MLRWEVSKLYKSDITLEVNGEMRSVYVRNADTLLYVLREELGLTGAKPGCLNGDCGACTVVVDGEAMKSCLMLAVEAVGKKITTVEGLRGQPIQTEFTKKFAFQCGYCTPGFIMNCHSLINKYTNPDDTHIKDCLESNICRCTGYKEIKDAVKKVLSSEPKP